MHSTTHYQTQTHSGDDVFFVFFHRLFLKLSLLQTDMHLYRGKRSVTLNSSYYNSSNVCLSVCLFVCSPTPPRSFDGSSPNLLGVCRWTSELPLRGSFLKRSMGGSMGQTSLFRSRQHQAETTPLQKVSTASFPSKRHTASKSLIPSTGIFTSSYNSSSSLIYLVAWRYHD